MFTDDADRGDYCGAAPFLPHEDYDPMYEGPGDAPKCGGPAWVKDGREQWNEGCPGCRHCDPVDFECKPYGWGFERFEGNEVYRLAAEMRANAAVVLGCDVGGPVWFRRYLEWIEFDFALEAKSDRVWERLCWTCQTHARAVELYTRWAKRVTR